jgi:uncharacterized membrane protein YagU involved in acid resistance
MLFTLLKRSPYLVVAGILATIPMTLWMLSSNRLLPSKNKTPQLPPETITTQLADKAGLEEQVDTKPEREQATTLSHYAMGAAMALPFMLFGKKQHSIKTGLFYGFLVWLMNYVFALPKLRLYPPATQLPSRMNFIMLIAHFIWGASLAKMNPK